MDVRQYVSRYLFRISVLLSFHSYFFDPNYDDQISFTTVNTQSSSITFLSKSHKFESQLNFSLATRLLSDRTYLLLAIGVSIAAYILVNILWYVMYRFSGMRVVIQSMFHYFGFKTKIFDLTFENNPGYFDSLPLSLLEWRIQSQIMTGMYFLMDG